jgi:hypothetical protein
MIPVARAAPPLLVCEQQLQQHARLHSPWHSRLESLLIAAGLSILLLLIKTAAGTLRARAAAGLASAPARLLPRLVVDDG